MDMENIGRRVRLIRRNPDGQTSLYVGVLLQETETTWTIRTDRGEERSEPKFYSSVEWLTPARQHKEGE